MCEFVCGVALVAQQSVAIWQTSGLPECGYQISWQSKWQNIILGHKIAL